ncbi:hypothetical protein I2486_08195 [Cellulophaga sp. E16_2]|uniref:AbiH family protein n=1 Tax=Cellulophaga sp. E16_2 TaxID=2789297 RepID=UPI001A91C6CA|nr:AbiH family protein [Cellulophaga sp. E16_2]MBO0591388.1 hypothetical protein [Cellulophaga sp. E16_2]
MNKLIIIGNGFDLAHGLPTSYKHFIDNFWRNLSENYKEDKIKGLAYVNQNYHRCLNNSTGTFEEFIISLKEYSEEYSYVFDPENYSCKTSDSKNIIFEFRNNFFKIINKSSILNWVDIENEYYQKLKSICKRKKADSIENNNNKEYSNSIKILNDEFEQIKLLFEKYLIENINEKFDFEKNTGNSEPEEILKYFNIEFQDLENHKNLEILAEFPKEDHKSLIEFDNNLKNKQTQNLRNEVESINLFLNFNYTNTANIYIKKINNYNDPNYDFRGSALQIQIHGRLKDKANEMNFGFGDEMDEDYKLIENLDNNEYLKNFKSFKYLQNSNYKQLIDFIDSSKFQVYIMGHSCGLSDRTMLNTIFEHDNCRSIKVFYYQWKNENEEINDNYTELIQNISRHFNDKKIMRSKIVNKSLCNALPQDIRFIKKPIHE